jgi:phenylpropionate dioxygenase-like ring-hydroxylating dioxygenase large terminal subunit
MTIQADHPQPVAIRPRYQLPAVAYYDEAWYEREQRLLFGRTYNLVGYEADLPEPGDHLVTRAGMEPVLVVRGHDGVVRAFVNMCRHRGMVLACESGHSDGRLRCPYHGWEFGLDGALERVPQRQAQFPDLDADALGLVPLAVGLWAGMVFVHPGTDPEPFEEWLGDYGAEDKAGPFPWADLVPVARIKVPLQCNWKLYMENHIDIYHLWYLHEESLGMYDHHALTHWKEGRHWGCIEPLRGAELRVRSGMLPIAGLPESERDQLRANLIWPNVPMSTSETTVITYQVVPTGPDSCELDIRVQGMPGSVLEAPERDILKVLRDEDGFACEQMQAVIRSPRFGVGPLAVHHERPIHDFHADVLGALE